MTPDNTPPSNTPNDSPDTQQTGKNMMIIACVLGLGLLTWGFGNLEERQNNPNASPNTAYLDNATEVSLTRNRYGHYVSGGTINGEPVTFLLDTGATNVAIPGELQLTLGLEAGRTHYSHTANGTAKAYSTVIDSLSLGGIELKNVKASIIPTMEGKEILLGMNVLKQLDFSQKGNQLTLRQNH